MLEQFGLEPCGIAAIRVGQKYGRLMVLAVGKKPNSYRYMAVCSCDCGSAPRAYRADHLKERPGIGCGCVQKQRTTKHGMYSNPLYKIWHSMKRRCESPRDARFQDYGGRGIHVCGRWQSLDTFLSDMSRSYRRGLQLDRINNDGPYEPSNCRWVKPAAQARNKRTNIMLTLEGRTMCVAEWAREVGINYFTLLYRVKELGWSHKKALTTPAN